MASLTPAQRVDRVLEECTGADLSSWEKFEFLPSIRQREALTEKQEKVLGYIEQRIFENEE